MKPSTLSTMFSSASGDWATPQDVFDLWNLRFNFQIDVCADDTNAKCTMYWSKADDALAQDWSGYRAWMNPPYGRDIGRWVRKAWESSMNGATVVCLLPARTDTSWWHDYCTRGTIHFVRGRLKFGGSKNSAPFPSAIVIFLGTI